MTQSASSPGKVSFTVKARQQGQMVRALRESIVHAAVDGYMALFMCLDQPTPREMAELAQRLAKDMGHPASLEMEKVAPLSGLSERYELTFANGRQLIFDSLEGGERRG